MLKTPVCDLLGIEYPVFQGGMAWIADASLASAVSNGGGLGIISAMNANGEWVRQEIRKCKGMTDKPFGVNIMLMSPFADEVAKVVVEEGVPVLTTGAGNPGKYMPAWLEAGIKVIPVIASCGLARRMEKCGAAAVVAEGGESGGHIGEMSTMPLVPQVVDAVKIPVIAAGGIGDGRGLAAALMLGAAGVQMGTRFLVANECTVHPNYKKRVLDAGDTDTVATGRSLGHAVRSLKTPFSREYAKKEFDVSFPRDELEQLAVGVLRKAAVEGNEKEGCFLAGQISGMVSREQPAAEIVREVCEQAEALLKGAAKWVR